MKKNLNKTISRDIARVKDENFYSEETITDLLLSELRKHKRYFEVDQIRDKKHEGKIGADFILKYKTGGSISFQAKKIYIENNRLIATFHKKKDEEQIRKAIDFHKENLQSSQLTKYDHLTNFLLLSKTSFNQADLQLLDFLFQCINNKKLFWPLTIFYICPSSIKLLEKKSSSHTLVIADSLQLVGTRMSRENLPFQDIEPYLFQIPKLLTFECLSDRFYWERFRNRDFFKALNLILKRKIRSTRGYFYFKKRKGPNNSNVIESILKERLNVLTNTLEKLIQNASINYTDTLFFKNNLEMIRHLILRVPKFIFLNRNSDFDNTNDTSLTIFDPSSDWFSNYLSPFFNISRTLNEVHQIINNIDLEKEETIFKELSKLSISISKFLEAESRDLLIRGVSPLEFFSDLHEIHSKISLILNANREEIIQHEKDGAIEFLKDLNEKVQKLHL